MKNLFLIFFSCMNGIAFSQTGITWSAPMDVAPNTYDNLRPRIATDGSGNPIIIWGRDSDESVFITRWNGSGFPMPVKVNPNGFTIATQTWMGPELASKGDTVYVTMKQTPEGEDTSNIFIARSIDGSATFTAPIQIDNIADSISRFPVVTTDANGNPIVGFMKFDAAFGDARWVVAKSTDLGNNFQVDVLASGWSGGTVCDCCPGGITASGNTVAMMYRDNLSNIRDMWAGISSDGGASFTQGMAIDQGNWMLMSCPSSGPDGEIIGDTLYSTYMSGESGSNLVYFNKSSISNIASSNGTPITGMFAGLTSQLYPRMAKSGNAIGIAWKQNAGGNSQLAFQFTNNVANDFSSNYDTVATGNIISSDVAIVNGKVYLTWEDDNTGTVKFCEGTYAPFVGIQESNFANAFSFSPNPASEIITIQNGNETIDNLNISVSNVFGQNVYSGINLFSQGKILLNTAAWVGGVYFITLEAENSIYTQRVVISHN